MAKQIIECVPNFSEGRDLEKIKQITDEIEKVSGVKLLDVDPGADTNRTVVTIVGPVEPVMEAAFQAVKKAAELIDMSKHSGAHARMGATDVVPFVPVSNITMEETAKIAHKVGKRIGEELDIPIYMYEEAATKPEWKNLAVVRSGEYEALEEKLKEDYWKPDYGPAEFKPKVGATAVSAREFLIAYNINLNSRDKRHAFDIAFNLRYKGRSKRKGNTDPYYFKGRIVRYRKGHFPCGYCEYVGKNLEALADHYKKSHGLDLKEEIEFWGREYDEKELEGKAVRFHGKYRDAKAVGWYIDEYKRTQITINFTNYKKTPIHEVVEYAREEAYKRGVIITGSELVGLIPYEAILQAGLYYLQKQDRSIAIPWRDIVETAVQSLGLRDVSEFALEKDVLGMPDDWGELAKMSLADFADEVSRESVAPGGGSIAAYAGALGAALGNMVGNITLTKNSYYKVYDEIHGYAKEAQKIKDELVYAVDRDTDAFNDVMQAMRMPNSTKKEEAARDEAIQEGYKNATRVPLRTAELCFRAVELCHKIAQIGNKNSISDAGVGALTAEAGVVGAAMNVLINLPNIKDDKFREEMTEKLDYMRKQSRKIRDATEKLVEEKIKEM
ncbi:MAG: glutamate formimidoyltransferase [Candidatus Zixiibacteriota bacterium]